MSGVWGAAAPGFQPGFVASNTGLRTPKAKTINKASRHASPVTNARMLLRIGCRDNIRRRSYHGWLNPITGAYQLVGAT